MKCSRCGRKNPAGAVSCAFCQAPMEAPKKRNSAHAPKSQRRTSPALLIAIAVLSVLFIGIVVAYLVQNHTPRTKGFSGSGGSASSYESGRTCRVVFNLNCQTDAPQPEAQTVFYGQYASLPVIKDRKGYIISGWYTDPACTVRFNFHAPIYQNCELYAGWIDIIDKTDTDGDGLTDAFERYYRTDAADADTDGDGLSDYYELYVLGLDPTLADTDRNGIPDGSEDFDGDGLTNLREKELGTDPTKADTDGDGLDDASEVNVYKTDPLKADTDGDGVSDGKEIQLGTDPLTKQNTFSVVYEAEASERVTDATAFVYVNLSGKQVDSLKIRRVEDSVLFPKTMPGYMGPAYDFSVSGNIKNAVVSFRFNVSDNIDPVIYCFGDETNGLLKPLPTTVSGNVASTTVNAFSRYILLDRKAFERAFYEIDASVDIKTDSDNDGIPDYFETGLTLFNGVKIILNKDDPDVDKDGLKDGDEIRLVYEYNADKTKVVVRGIMLSDPTKKDTDNDGIADASDTAPFEKGLAGGIVGALTVSSYGTSENKYNGFSGHAYLTYTSFVEDSKYMYGICVTSANSTAESMSINGTPSWRKIELSPNRVITLSSMAEFLPVSLRGTWINNEYYMFSESGVPRDQRSLTCYLTDEQVDKLAAYTKNYSKWSLLYNDAAYASEIWNAVVGDNLSAKTFWNSPTKLSYSIQGRKECKVGAQMLAPMP